MHRCVSQKSRRKEYIHETVYICTCKSSDEYKYFMVVQTTFLETLTLHRYQGEQTCTQSYHTHCVMLPLQTNRTWKKEVYHNFPPLKSTSFHNDPRVRREQEHKEVQEKLKEQKRWYSEIVPPWQHTHGHCRWVNHSKKVGLCCCSYEGW